MRKADLARYPLDIFTLIPLHKHDATRTMPNEKVVPMGKAPLHKNWQKRPYDSAAVLEDCFNYGQNVGVRLTDEVMVIDIDPRNGGDDGILNLAHDIGLDLDAYPTVITGSGGRHVYMSKPPGRIRDTLDADNYQGVEFKSEGRQVVAAGSRHPNGKHYMWSEHAPRIEDGLKAAPRNLLTMIKRPPRTSVQGGGQYTPAQIADMLATVQPEHVNTNDKWLKVMQACHHASAGDARTEFIQWSISDPNYANDADVIGRRWDSLHTTRNDGVTYRTLMQFISKFGDRSSIPTDRQAVRDDFADASLDSSDDADIDIANEVAVTVKPTGLKKDEGDGLQENFHGLTSDSIAALERLNREYTCTIDNGKFQILTKRYDPAQERNFWESLNKHDFETYFCNTRLERDVEEAGLTRYAATTVPLGKAWIEWINRNDAKAVIFDPSTTDVKKGILNLWEGFGTSPDPDGSWQWTRDLIYEVLADGNEEIGRYIERWIAYMIQFPAVPAESCIVLKGEMGVGKSTLGNIITKLIGQHAMAINSPAMLVGRFNSHLRDLIFLFADEAVNAYDKVAEGVLKALITEPMINIERKGVDLQRAKNILHMLMCSNNSYVVPAGPAERRFMVQDVSSKWMKTNNFDKLHAELDAKGGTGYGRMMFDALNYTFPKVKVEGREKPWHPRMIPATKALIEQKRYSMPPVPRFLSNVISDRQIGVLYEGDWMKGPIEIFMEDFRDIFANYCKANDIRQGSAGRSSNTLLAGEIKEAISGVTIGRRMEVPSERIGEITVASDGKAPSIRFPSLYECAAQLESKWRFPAGTLGVVNDDEMEFG